MKNVIEYYLMRHATYYDHDNQFVTYYGMLELKRQMDYMETELAEKFSHKKLRIIHSLLPRAKHTALLMKEMLSKTIEVSCEGDSRLNSDQLGISDAYVKREVASCERKERICLILSHQPDIEYFCKVDLSTSSYVRKSVDIEESVAVPEKDNDEDLPF